MEDADFYLSSFKNTVTQLEALLNLSTDSRDIIRALPYNLTLSVDEAEIAAQFYG